MRRVVRVVKSDGARHLDSVMLAPDQRRLQTAHLTGVNGTLIGLMLPEPVTLRMGDAFELDGGDLVEIVVEPEALTEIRANDLTHLARLAWHLGDRHVPIQVLANRIRMRRDAALEAMLAALGATIDRDRGAVRSGGRGLRHACGPRSATIIRPRSRPCAGS